MNSYINTRNISYDIVSVLLIIIASMAFVVSPISISVSAGGSVSFTNTAVAGDITTSTHASANSAANSVVGLLGIYKQSFAKSGYGAKTKDMKDELSETETAKMHSLVRIDFDEELDMSEASGDPDR